MVGMLRLVPGEPLFAARGKIKTRVKTSPPIKPIQPDLFEPRPERESLKRFAVLGDPGSGTIHQKKIAEALWKSYQESPFDSVFVMGDNCYEEGHPHQFHKKMYSPYKKLFEAGVRFYPMLGNHDVRKGFADQQLAYWGAPSFYNISLGKDLEAFVLDTTVLLPDYEKCYPNNKGYADKVGEIQMQWLEKALADSPAKSKIVLGHYPIYSSGDVSDDHDWQEKLAADDKHYQILRNKLEPLLVKHGVDLYLAGHEHHYETSHPISGVTHIVTGGAGKLGNIRYEQTAPYPRKALVGHRYHFMRFEQTDEGLAYQAIGKQGKVLDSGLVPTKTAPRFSKLA